MAVFSEFEQQPNCESLQQVSSAEFFTENPSDSQHPNSVIEQHKSSANYFVVVLSSQHPCVETEQSSGSSYIFSTQLVPSAFAFNETASSQHPNSQFSQVIHSSVSDVLAVTPSFSQHPN